MFKPTNADDVQNKQINIPMKLATLTKITRWTICLVAIALAIGACFYNPGHLVTAALLFIIGIKVEWKQMED